MTKTFKQIREIDVPKGHEYGPSSRKRPAGKAGYTSSDSARTTHLKSVKRDAKKKRRQGDKEFANEEVPANATGTAVAGTGDDSSTVVVKKKKEQQSKLMKRITDSIDKAIPDIKKEEDEIITRKNQLKELAKNRNV